MFRKRMLFFMLPVLMLCGCSQAEQKKNEDAEGMLYLEATGSGEINENRFTVERKEFVTDMEYEASLVASFYSEIYMPEKKASYSVAKLVKKDGDMVKTGDAIMVLKGSYDDIDKKEKELEKQRIASSFEKKCSEYTAGIKALNDEYLLSGDESVKSSIDSLTYEYDTYKAKTEKTLEAIDALLFEYDLLDREPELTIYANADGKLLYEKAAAEGNQVTDKDLLVKIIDVTRQYYRAENGYQYLSSGMELDLKNGSDIIKGKVLISDHETEKMSVGGALITIEENADGPLPEKVSFIAHPVSWKNMLAVPTQAVKRDSENASYVMCLKDGKKQRVYIDIVTTINEYSLLIDGPSEGDIVCY